MELDLGRLRDTMLGEFLKCAMMSDAENITSYNQSSLDLKVLLDGNEINLRKLFSSFEDRLGYLDVPSEKRKELIAGVESSLVGTNDFVDSVNDERRTLVRDLREALSRVNVIIENQRGDRRAISVTSDLDSLLGALK